MTEQNRPPGSQVGMHPPSLDEIEDMANRALAELPEDFRRHLGDIVFCVQEFAEDDVLDELGIDHPLDLMGLYQGVDMARKSVLDPQPHVDMVFLYRRAILDYWLDSGEPLEHVVRHVLVHEIGHHFGLSDEDMHAIEEAASDDMGDDSDGEGEG